MTYVFWLCAAAMILLALVLVLRPLLRRDTANDAQVRRLAALDAAREAGVLDQAEYSAKRRVLEASGTTKATPTAPLPLVLVLALTLPLAAVLIYRAKGSPQSMDPAFATAPAAGTANAPSMDQAIDSLAARMKAQPDDLEGWVLLGRAYRTTERFKEASDAFAKALALAPDDPDLKIEAMELRTLASEDKSLAGEPRKVIDEVLAQDPQNQRALWLLGVSEAQAGNYAGAAAAWERLLPLLPAGENVTRNVQTQIAEARLRGKLPASTVEPGPPLPGSEATAAASPDAPAQNPEPAAADGPRLVVTVDVSPELREKIAQGSTLFVFARMPEGPKMPLSIQRLAVASFPVTITLDDSMGMPGMPMKLSGAQTVVVGARISKSGIANAQAGDFEAFSAPFAPQGEVPVAITIDSVVP